jgi:hypothetical protein
MDAAMRMRRRIFSGRVGLSNNPNLTFGIRPILALPTNAADRVRERE